MADSKIILPDDSANTGKNLDTAQVTVAAVTVQRERHVIADNIANNYVVVNADGSLLCENWDGSNVIGTAAHPIRNDPTGTTIQPVNGTVTANIGSSGSLALDASLTSGSGKIQVYDGTQVIFVSAHPGYVQFAAAQHVILDAGSAVIGHVIVDSGAITASFGPATSGGTSEFHLVSAGSNNATNIKNAAGQFYGISVFNNAGYPIYVKIYNKATTPAPATDNALLVRVFGVQAGTQRDFSTIFGIPCGSGIGVAIVKGISDTDNTPVLASDCVIDIDYK